MIPLFPDISKYQNRLSNITILYPTPPEHRFFYFILQYLTFFPDQYFPQKSSDHFPGIFPTPILNPHVPFFYNDEMTITFDCEDQGYLF